MKTGFTCSCFDLFHAGHIMMLKEAKSKCDYLIVGLQTDPTIDRPEKNKPIQSLVWSLQNMTYDIEDDYGVYKHTVNYKFYHCDYNSTVVHVKNTSKLRDEKIDSLLNDN